ncbi:hypothetical protein LAZ67_X003341, partial [Cordylochernes scorpioides]
MENNGIPKIGAARSRHEPSRQEYKKLGSPFSTGAKAKTYLGQLAFLKDEMEVDPTASTKKNTPSRKASSFKSGSSTKSVVLMKKKAEVDADRKILNKMKEKDQHEIKRGETQMDLDRSKWELARLKEREDLTPELLHQKEEIEMMITETEPKMRQEIKAMETLEFELALLKNEKDSKLLAIQEVSDQDLSSEEEAVDGSPQAGLRAQEWVNNSPPPVPTDPRAPATDSVDTLVDVFTKVLQQQQKVIVNSTKGDTTLPHFDGAVERWIEFKEEFNRTTSEYHISDSQNLIRLRKALSGKAYDHVKHLIPYVANVKLIMEALEQRFGKPRFIIKNLLRTAQDCPQISVQKPDTILGLNISVKGLISSCMTLAQPQYMDSIEHLDTLTRKLPAEMKEQWLRHTERKLAKDPLLLAAYKAKFDEYLEKGYIRKLDSIEVTKGSERTWYIPHFGVTNPNKPGKLRLVFDAAARLNGESLNEALSKGPDLIRPLTSVLWNFRVHNIALNGDITDMFHRVRVIIEDQCSQRFLWRNMNTSIEPDHYEMQVLIFGATSSPCSAIHVKNENAMQHELVNHELAHTIVNDFYVDDCLTGADSEEKCMDLRRELSEVNTAGEFHLCKFNSNSRAVIESIPEELLPRCHPDLLSRSIIRQVEVHTFVDASQEAFSAVTYLRVETRNGNITTTLFGSKARVSPLKKLTIPKLELHGCVLGTRFAVLLRSELRLSKVDREVFWSDSKTVLAWIRSEAGRYKEFVANRVGEIQEATKGTDWRWVPTSENPADIATRFETEISFKPTDMWYTGPEFLKRPEEEWPKEAKGKDLGIILANRMLKLGDDSRVLQTSLNRLVCRAAAVQKAARFWHKKTFHKSGEFNPPWKAAMENNKVRQHSFTVSPEEYRSAATTHVQWVQTESFPREIADLAKGRIVKKAKIAGLSPCLINGNICLKSRILQANKVPAEQKTPAILPSDHHLTELLIQAEHERCAHQGSETLLNNLHGRFWIIDGRQTVLRTIRKCPRCRLSRASPVIPEMSQLPHYRLSAYQRPFTFTELDAFGPFTVTVGRRHEKRWVINFTCLVTRAIHLEVVHALSTDEFMMGLSRFIDTRGRPDTIYSDNGTNFVGASKELKLAASEIDFEVMAASGRFGPVKWKFNPPAAPHFGGAWERLIKSVKKCLRATLNEVNPKDTTLLTALKSEENIINSRLLTYVSSDPTEEDSLTGRHARVQGTGETIRLEIMGEELKEIKEKIETLYDELFSLDEVDIDKESEAYDGSMNKIGSLRVKIENERKLKEKLADIKPKGSQANIKLPQFDLPIYDGDMGKWINFKELFLTTIDAHPGLTNIQKLQYLNSAVKGEAARLIRGFPLLSENYGQAWSTLLSRYDNPRELAYAQVSKIFSLRAIKNPSAKCLHEFMDVCNEAIRNLETLELKRNQLVDVILVHFLQQKLSENLRLDWELSMDNTLPSYDKFIAFISRHARSMSCAVKECSKREETTGSRFPKCQSYGMLIEKSDTCILCKSGHHPLYMCNLFCKMPLKEKLNVVKGHKLCFNCLGKGHFSWNCRLNQRCKVCKGKHHTMIHYDKPSTEGASAQVENTTPKEHESAINLTNTQQANCNDSHVLLATARIKIKNGLGKLCTCRALLDSGSQVTMITKGCCERLGLVQRKSDRMIIGVGNTPVQHSSSTVSVTFCPLNNSEEFSVEAVVTGVLTSEIPNFRLKDPNWPTLKNLKLADPEFYIQAPIDMILGADIYTELMLNGSISLGEGLPMAINTRLGWVLLGKLMGTSESNTEVCNLSLQSEPELEFVMKRFWEIESVPSPDLCTQDEDCERLFSNNHGRDSHGRYWVKLPFRQHRPLLGESREKALRRFLSLEGKLCKNVKLYDQYRGFMKEYEHLNHMERVPIAEVKRELCRCYYMPHHPVIREQSTTTKMRVVFDASAKSENNVSSNQFLHKGPKIQQDVFFILLRFRTYPVAITADIEKMYRQIRIHPEDADYQRILWRPSPEEPVVDYRLLTVTYGTTSAPFLAMRTLQQLAEDEGQNYPEASRMTLNDFYVDDLLTGAQTIAETKELIDQLKDLMKKGGFHLRKWNSNCQEIVSHVEEMNEEKKINLEKGAISKILGIVWDHVQDTFRVNITLPEEVVTKRDLLSNIARIFDPLGFLSPTTVAMANLQRQTAVKEVEDLEGLPVYHRAILKENGEWPEVTKAIQCSYPKVFVGDGTYLYLLIEDVESLDGPNVRSVLYQYHIPHKKWIWRGVNGFAPIVISKSIVYASHDKRVYFVGGRIHSRGNKVTCTDNIVRVKLKEGRASVLVKSRKSPLTDLLVLAMTFAPSAFLFMLAETRDHSTYKVFSYHLLNKDWHLIGSDKIFWKEKFLSLQICYTNKKLLQFPRMQWEQHFCNLYNYRLQTDSWGCYTTIPILGEKEGYPKNINHFTIVQDWVRAVFVHSGKESKYLWKLNLKSKQWTELPTYVKYRDSQYTAVALDLVFILGPADKEHETAEKYLSFFKTR